MGTLSAGNRLPQSTMHDVGMLYWLIEKEYGESGRADARIAASQNAQRLSTVLKY